MNLDEVDALLTRTPLPLETGYERLNSGALHVAVRTDMHGCTGEMLEWWFRSRCDTERYVWWHPIDHVSSEWQGRLGADTHIGSEHVVTERMSGLPAADLLVQFVSPDELFTPDSYAAAVSSGEVSGAVVGRVANGHEPSRDANGAVIGGRLLHIARDTTWGMALRSHFFIGTDLPMLGFDRKAIVDAVPDSLAPALLQHAYDEFTFLSRFLPSLHLAEHRNERVPSAPW